MQCGGHGQAKFECGKTVGFSTCFAARAPIGQVALGAASEQNGLGRWLGTEPALNSRFAARGCADERLSARRTAAVESDGCCGGRLAIV